MRAMLALLVVAGVVLSSSIGQAGVEVFIDTGAAPPRAFLALTSISRSDFHLGRSSIVDTRLIASGAPQTIPLSFTNPLVFEAVSVVVYHPEYRSESSRSKEMPFLFKSVTLPRFTPGSWRDIMASGIPIQKVGMPDEAVRVMDVQTQLQVFLQWYLLVVDETRAREPLETYLALFKDLVAYTKRTSAGTTYDASTDARLRQSPDYAAVMQREEERTLRLLDTDLREIEAVLSLTVAQRGSLRRLRAHAPTRQGVVDRLMDDADRARLLAFLDAVRRANPPRQDPPATLGWTNVSTGLAFAVTAGHWHNVETAPAGEVTKLCIQTTLTVRLKLEGPARPQDSEKTHDPSFCSRGSQAWQLQ
ncbi:MAG: hypothetical protein ACREIK_07015 [Nitrospiraceae bacterium]